MKTLDKKTYFKSCDCAQMLYVHNEFLDLNSSKLKNPKNITFDALNDPNFKANLFNDWFNPYGSKNKNFMFRHGLTPGSKNIKNWRWK